MSIAPFLRKSYDLVDDANSNSIIAWGPSGRSFIVYKPAEFARDLLPQCFKHNNFSSFVRQLNTYGFRKVDPERWEFSNENFQQGRRDLLGSIIRRKPATATKAAQGDDDDDDGFERSSLPAQSPRQPLGGYSAAPSPRDQYPAPSPRDPSFPAPSPREASFSGPSHEGGYAGPSPRDAAFPPQPDASAFSNGGLFPGSYHASPRDFPGPAPHTLASPRNFGGGFGASGRVLSDDALNMLARQTSASNGDVDMGTGRRVSGNLGATGSAFGPPAGPAMGPPPLHRSPRPTPAAPQQAPGAAGLQGMQRFNRLVDNVIGSSGSGGVTAAGTERSASQPSTQPLTNKSTDSQHSTDETTSAGHTNSAGASGGEPQSQISNEDNTHKKRKYRRSAEVRRPMDDVSERTASGNGSGSTAGIARPVATSYGDMTSAMMTEMAAQLARMGQLAIDVENLKSRNAALEAELAQVNREHAGAPSQQDRNKNAALEARLKASEDWQAQQDARSKLEDNWKAGQEAAFNHWRQDNENRSKVEEDWKALHENRMVNMWHAHTARAAAEDNWKATAEYKFKASDDFKAEVARKEADERVWKSEQERRAKTGEDFQSDQTNRALLEQEWKASQEVRMKRGEDWQAAETAIRNSNSRSTHSDEARSGGPGLSGNGAATGRMVVSDALELAGSAGGQSDAVGQSAGARQSAGGGQSAGARQSGGGGQSGNAGQSGGTFSGSARMSTPRDDGVARAEHVAYVAEQKAASTMAAHHMQSLALQNQSLETRLQLQEQAGRDHIEAARNNAQKFLEQQYKNQHDALKAAQMEARLLQQERLTAQNDARNGLLETRIAELTRLLQEERQHRESGSLGNTHTSSEDNAERRVWASVQQEVMLSSDPAEAARRLMERSTSALSGSKSHNSTPAASASSDPGGGGHGNMRAVSSGHRKLPGNSGQHNGVGNSGQHNGMDVEGPSVWRSTSVTGSIGGLSRPLSTLRQANSGGSATGNMVSLRPTTSQ